MDYNELLNAAMDVGAGLLKNGGEVYRVEESIQRIFKAYGISAGEVFAIPSFIVATVTSEDGVPHTRSMRIDTRDVNLEKVDLYNDLCRRICATQPAFSRIYDEIKQIDAKKAYRLPQHIVAGMLIAFAFVLLFDGSFSDALAAIFCGAAAKYTYLSIARFRANTFFIYIVSSFMPAVLALLFVRLGFGRDSAVIITGSLMNLVPGVAITNFMRDIMAGDLVSGLTKLTESLLIGAAIALGAGAAISLFKLLLGVM